MTQSLNLPPTINTINLSEVQKTLEPFYPEVERSIFPILARLGYDSAASKKVVLDYLSIRRTCEQVDLLMRYTGPLRNKKILEVGSGFGLFVAFTNRYLAAHTSGIEPAESEFESTYQVAAKLMRAWSIDPGVISRGRGESIPFQENTFDIVYSTNVLEHVLDPKLVMQESVRILKPGGILQFVVPNYGSFWEGHYAVPWIPYLSKKLARIYIRLMGRDPWFIDTLCLINYFSLKDIIQNHLVGHDVEVIDWGESLFMDRMARADFSDWGGLSNLKRWVQAANKFGVSRVTTQFLVAIKAQTPLVLTLRKRAI